MLKWLRKSIPDTSFIRLFYHKMWAVIGAFIYRFPGRKLKVIAITGTNGKTTVTNMIAQALTKLGKKIGMTSTVNFQIGDKIWSNKTKQTTLGRFGLQKLLRQMVREECEYAVIEMSSIAVTQSRVWGIPIDVVVMTNLTDDHLEYHGNFYKYREAKAKLFKKFHKYSILNCDDAHFDYFNKINRGKKITYGIHQGDFHVTCVSSNPSGSEMIVNTNEGPVDLKISMPGFLNIYNALAAFAALSTFGFKYSDIAEALSKVRGAPGRFEKVEINAPFDVIVDYAHDHVSLEKLLQMYKDICSGRLISVFGATGGGRDKMKRPKMGAVAEKYADIIILTNDDPYEDDQMEIIEMIASGIHTHGNVHKILDRREAIYKALSEAREGDVVVISGKGGEEVIVLGTEKLPWDDRVIVKEFFR